MAVKTLMAGVACVVFAWSVDALTRPELTTSHRKALWQTVLGETFDPGDMDRLRTVCSGYARNTHPQASWLAAMLASRDVELTLSEGAPEDVAKLIRCAADAAQWLIRTNPASSHGWLMLAWLATLDGGDPARATRYLERSVAMAPREVWMAHKRVPLMTREILRGRLDLARADYRMLVEGELTLSAAALLRVCVGRNPLCEVDWNDGLPSQQTLPVWREMTRDE